MKRRWECAGCHVDSESLAEDTEALIRLAARPRVLVKIGAFYALSASGPPYWISCR